MEEVGYTLINELEPSTGIESNDLFITQKDGQEFKANAQQIKAFTSPAATINNEGVVSIAEQSFKGTKNFVSGITSTEATFTEDVTCRKNQTVEGTLFVNGDIIQNGSSYETEVETLKVKDQMIVTREGATQSMADDELTGIKATLYDGENNGVLAFDKNGIGRIGDEGDEQAIATREDNPTDGAAAIWDEATLKYISKQIDNTVTSGSSNLITSGAVKSALTKSNVGLGNVANVGTTSIILSGSEENITSGAVYSALSEKMDSKEVDTQPTEGSENLITSGAVKAAIDSTPGSRPVDDEPTEGSTNFVTSGGIYSALISMVYPVGCTYMQFPDTASPNELFKGTTWENISSHYAGLFPRIAGNNAEEFNKRLNCSVGGTTVSFTTSSHGVTTSSLLINPNTWEQRAVTAVNGNTVTIESAFSNSANITNVLVVQNDTLQGHKHNVYAVNNAQNKSITLASGNTGYGCSANSSGGRFVDMAGMESLNQYGNVRYSKETRSVNITINIWKRIN